MDSNSEDICSDGDGDSMDNDEDNNSAYDVDDDLDDDDLDDDVLDDDVLGDGVLDDVFHNDDSMDDAYENGHADRGCPYAIRFVLDLALDPHFLHLYFEPV